MWQRFTSEARKIVFYAQEEAQKCGEGYVSTEHLLLGVCRQPNSAGAQVLLAFDLTVDQVVAEVLKSLPQGDSRPSQDMTLTPRAKRVIDLAYSEARDMNNDYIGSEHIVLGLTREGDGIAGRVLAKLGVDLENAQKAAIALQAGAVPTLDERPFRNLQTSPDTGLFEAACESLIMMGLEQWRNPSELLLLMCLSGGSEGAKALSDEGVNLVSLRRVVEVMALNSAGSAENSPPTGYLDTILQSAVTESEAQRTPITSKHLLLAILKHDKAARDLINDPAILERLRKKEGA